MTSRTYLIAKAQDQLRDNRRTGLAQMATGGAVAAGTPLAYRGEMRYRAGVRNKAEAGRAAAIGQARTAIASEKARRVPGANPEAKARSQAKVRRQHGAISEANRVANATIKHKGQMRFFNQQSRTWAAGAAIGGGLALTGALRRDKAKGGHDHTTAASAAGALGGAGAYHGASIAAKLPEKKAERKINADPELKRKLESHRAAHLPKNATAGHPGWKSFNRQYPKDLPGARPKRFWGHATSGKSGLLATGVIAGASGLAALKHEEHRHQVGKSFLPGGQAKFANRLSHLERRRLKMGLEQAARKRGQAPLPGLGKTSGFSTEWKSQGPYYAKIARKTARRTVRQQAGQKVSPVRRGL